MAWNRERGSKSSLSAARNAVQLRRSMTEPEKRLWNGLRYELECPDGTHFRRQFAIGDYIVDFVCLQFRLVIEVDGPVHTEERQVLRDSQKDAFLKQQGFTVLRFTNEDALIRRTEVLNSVGLALAGTTPIRRLPPTPSPQGGRLGSQP
jgi:very-short-patch-repair endonuclease